MFSFTPFWLRFGSFWLLLSEPRTRQVASRYCFRMGRGYRPRIADRRISARRFPILFSLAFAYAHNNLVRAQNINLLSPTGEISAPRFPFLVKNPTCGCALARPRYINLLWPTGWISARRFPFLVKTQLAGAHSADPRILTSYRRQAGSQPGCSLYWLKPSLRMRTRPTPEY